MDTRIYYIAAGIIILFFIYKIVSKANIDIGKVISFLFGEKEAKSRAAKKAEKEGNFELAAKLYEEIGDTESVEKICNKEGLYQIAGEMFERKGNYDKAARYYIKQGNYQRASDLYITKLNNLEKAAQVLKESRRYHEAAKLYYENKKYKEAGELYEKIGFPLKAAYSFEQMGDIKRAAQNYENWYTQNSSFDVGEIGENEEKILRKAIKFYRKMGEREKALNLALSLKWISLAGELSEESGDLSKAAKYYEEARDLVKASNAYRKLGDVERAERLLGEHFLSEGIQAEAAKHFEKGRDFSRAAELYEWNNEPYKGAVCYEKEGHWLKAGELYIKAGELREGARCFEKAGEYPRAAEVYKEMAEKEKDTSRRKDLYKDAEELYVKGRKWFEAGSIAYYSLDDFESAVEYLQRLDTEDPNFEKASFMLGKLFFDRKEYDLAEERFNAALKEAPISKLNLDIYYKLGLIAEEKGDYKKAFEIFRAVSSFDIHYLDAKERMQKLSSAVQELQKLEFMASAPGERYKIIEEVGKGGMGTVYKAEDRLLSRIVALKLLREALTLNKRALERFIAEARTAAKLSHPNIVIVYDVGRFNEKFFIAMEYLEGKTLLNYLKEKGGFTIRQLLFIATRLFSALSYAHKNRVIHRDIKPQNIILTKDKKIKVMDFGLAILSSEIDKERGRITGTPYYMSPEQCKGIAVDERSDIYSAGATLYHLLVNRPPFHAKRREEIIRKQVEELPVSPSAFRRNIPPEFEELVMKCLAKERGKRFQSAKEAIEVLEIIRKKYF